MERDVADDAIALVEDGKNGDPLRHRGNARDRGICARGLFRRGLVLLLGAAVAAGERERHQYRCCDPVHAYSGIHGS
jgi:hypothetical protein